MVEWWKDMVERWNLMALNIKNEETNRMVRELAALKGISLVVAVTQAVQEKLEREKADREALAKTKKSRYELLMEFAKECGPLFKDGRSGNDLINDLYDDVTGLPK
jgi:antitoxin VapB